MENLDVLLKEFHFLLIGFGFFVFAHLHIYFILNLISDGLRGTLVKPLCIQESQKLLLIIKPSV